MTRWAVVVGSASDGKNAVAEAIVRACGESGLRVAGVIEEAVCADDVVVGYDAVDLGSSERIALARLADVPDVCRFRFDDRAFVECRRRAEATEADVVLWEAARLEAAGTGHWPAIASALESGAALVVLCVRARSLAAIALRLPDPAASLELPATEGAVAAFARELVTLARDVAVP